MNIRLFAIITISILAGIGTMQAQLNLPQTSIAGNGFYYYKVNNKESVSGIAKKLGITTDDIQRYNPWTARGVSKKQRLYFPVEMFATTNTQPIATAMEPIIHTVASGETLYAIAKAHNTTIEKIIELNPGLTHFALSTGDQLQVQPNTPALITATKDITVFNTIIAQKNETFETIAQKHNLPVATLMQANSELKKVKKGQVIYIPEAATTETLYNSEKLTEKELKQTYAGKLDKIYKEVHHIAPLSTARIAIILPFQLHKAEPTRQAYLYTDFYKGFLIAADSVSRKIGLPVSLSVFDTRHNLNVTDSILSLPQLQQMDAIISPVEPKQLERCNNFGKKNHVSIINTFSSQNTNYTENPYVVQLSMPTSALVASLTKWIGKTFQSYEIIFLESTQNTDEELYQEMKQQFGAAKLRCQTIKVAGTLTFNTLSSDMDPGTNYLIVPSTGAISFLNKIADALKEVKKNRFDCEVALLGQNDYLTQFKRLKPMFQSLNTYVFSRFFVANEKRGQGIENKFKAKYNDEMATTFPSMGILGHDVGEFVIKALAQQGKITDTTPYYDGIEMDVRLKRNSNWGGLVNRCIEIVHFSSTGAKESIIE